MNRRYHRRWFDAEVARLEKKFNTEFAEAKHRGHREQRPAVEGGRYRGMRGHLKADANG